MWSFSIHDLNSTRNICPNIGVLFDYMHHNHYDEKTLLKINELLDNITDEEIIADGEFAQHPFLHELCHQYQSSFLLLRKVWEKPVFEKYWENDDYLDKYGNTALQRLSLCLCTRNSDENNNYFDWIRENMCVIPSDKELNGRCRGQYLIGK